MDSLGLETPEPADQQERRFEAGRLWTRTSIWNSRQELLPRGMGEKSFSPSTVNTRVIGRQSCFVGIVFVHSPVVGNDSGNRA
jgi:hypothetical protein